MAKKIAGNPELDATMPTVEVNVHGRVYHMVFTNGAFSVALKKLREQKLNFNVLVNTDIRNLDEDTLPVMLFASFVTNHPDIKYAEVEAMIDINTPFRSPTLCPART